MTRRPDLLVVGAGPTGLTLALQAHDHGAGVRIVERREDAFRPSRAMIIYPRTLEVLRPLHVTDSLLDRANTAPSVVLHLGSREVPVRLDEIALPDTPFPHLTLLRQMDLEAILAAALADRGVRVERGTELVDLRVGTRGGDPVATLRSSRGAEECTAGTVAGCDGAESRVRTLSGIGWRGGGYRQEVVLADIEVDGDLDPGVAHVVAARVGLVFLFNTGERATWRLLATRPAVGGSVASTADDTHPPADELQRMLEEVHLAARITDVAWSSRVGLHHRMADHYRHGPIFLAGDAAHVHSPAGGQGMNTGIQDAVNLGWKIAFGPASSHRETLLQSYEDERRPVARHVLALTHLAFWAESSTNPLASFARGVLAPLGAPVLPMLLRWRGLLARGVRVLSQLDVGYRAGSVNVEGEPALPGPPGAGDRLPDAAVRCGGRMTRLHELTARPGVHVLLRRESRWPAWDHPQPFVHVHALTSEPGDGVIAARPDGYVGYRSGTLDWRELEGWLASVGAVGDTHLKR
jgi:2-polyprenyl-6-methoxyphenol hydroxylase-like FAD-dependent oxidoreductase